jgi:hypothetical protein
MEHDEPSLHNEYTLIDDPYRVNERMENPEPSERKSNTLRLLPNFDIP